MGLEQQNLPPYQIGGLPFSQTLKAVGDSIVYPVLGVQWGSVKLTFATQAGGPQYTISCSIDGGVNFLNSGSGAAYIRRIDAVSASPTVQAGVTLAISGQTHEFAIGSNVTHIRVIVTTAGNAQFVSVAGLQPYVSGCPIVATLFDVTSAVNTDNPTGILDLSGWAYIVVSWSAGGATTVGVTGFHVYNDGAAGANHTYGVAATAGDFSLSRQLGAAGTFYPSRRMSFDVTSVAAQATRLSIQAMR